MNNDEDELTDAQVDELRGGTLGERYAAHLEHQAQIEARKASSESKTHMVITLHTWRAMAANAAKDASHLSCVWFVPEGIFATDGHVLAFRAEAGETGGVSFGLPVADLAALTRGSGPGTLRIAVSGDTATVELRDRNEKFVASTVVTYRWDAPPITKLLDLSRPWHGQLVEKVGVNPKFLSRLELVAKAAGETCIAIRTSKPINPIVCTVTEPTTGVEWTMLIMPMRLPKPCRV